MVIPNLYMLTEYYVSSEGPHLFFDFRWGTEYCAEILRHTASDTVNKKIEDTIEAIDCIEKYLTSRGFALKYCNNEVYILPANTVN